MANIITGFRVLISIALLFCPVFSPVFYMLYLIAGLSDMIDGTIARRMNTVSEFGARFDTAADFVFVVVCLIKFLPVISIPAWLYVWIVLIALIKIIIIISGYVVQKKLVAVHSVMNKMTGVLLFILPLTFPIVPLKYLAIPVCAVATIAAVQEGHYIRTVEKGLDSTLRG
ncbi:MAG: CDP-alcohol phosphatidyltransferase family protein [Lachnospiraceae bacterium]|nr:CDP-alcohol phosphatidyltransferase family protein [Lachnospiraceae bacterium]